MNNNVKIFISIIGLLVLGVVVSVLVGANGERTTGPGKYDALAQCLTDKGAVFYGAFWCPHCQAQKKMFGSSAKLLPYVECSTLDGKSQLPICKDNGISSYPTWTFTDGTKMTGEVPLAQLATKTQCSLPEGESSSTAPTSGSTEAMPITQ